MSADIVIFFLSNIKIDEDKVEIKEKQWRILKIQGMKVPNRACVTNLTLLGTNIMIKVSVRWGPNYDLELAFLEIYLYDSWTCSHVQKIYALISYLPMSTIKKPNISEKKIESLPKTQIFLSLYHWNLINLILK